jgi:tetratricopeptide (TPR) repeat protein
MHPSRQARAIRPADEQYSAAKRFEHSGDIPQAIRCYLAAGSSFLNDASDPDKARQAFGAAAALDPKNLEAVFQLGHTDMIEGKLRDALAKFVDVVRKSGETHVAAMFEVGCIYQELGKYDQAILAFRKVLVRDRTNVQAIVNVARRLQAMGMRPEALGYYIKAADTAMEAKQFGTCRQLLNLILSIDPLNPKVRSMLAELSDLDAGDSIVISSGELPAALESDSNLQGLPQSPSEIEDGIVAMLRVEADGLKRDLKALGAAKASEEIELATLRARRDAATAELTELFKKVESLRPVEKPKPGGKTKPVAKPKLVEKPNPVVFAAPSAAPKERRAPTKSKTRPGRTPE